MDSKTVIKWLEYDYLPRVGAYRKDCKQGCDACMPMHDGDDYCDIDMLCKILAMLKEQEVAYQGAVELLRQKTILFDDAIKRLKEHEERIETLESLRRIEQEGR